MNFIFHPWEVILGFPKVWEHKGITNKIKQAICIDNQHIGTFTRSPAWALTLSVLTLIGNCWSLDVWDGQQDDLTLSRFTHSTVPVPSSVRFFLLHISSTTPATDDTQTLHQHPQRPRGNKARRCGISQSRRQLHRVPPHRRKGARAALNPLRLCRRHRTRFLCQRHSLAILSHGEKLDCEPRPHQLC